MKPAHPSLPIDDVLPAVIAALRSERRAVLQAPPGAGKTTRVPLALLEAGLTEGRILMLEPRRLAARAAAVRMADMLGEKVGETVGYRMRGAQSISARTRIEVVTEGILTRMIQADGMLDGIGALIFDEFHERSLQADLGLALAWDIKSALREDLLLLVMSATLDAARVAALLDNAPLISSEGRAFPVDIRWRDTPLPKTTRLPDAVAAQVRSALPETEGGVLVFLPGEGEIRRVAHLLSDLPDVRSLYGALPFAAQQKAVEEAPPGHRKVVLSTSIAETALTIRDVRVVIDAGRARRARYDPGRGMSALVTEPASKAEATQRAGRAGRVAPGRCYRLWTKGEDGGRPTFPPPEIASTDLASLVLDLALWGAKPADLAFLTPPPARAWDAAEAVLHQIGTMRQGLITERGKELAGLPLHPRLGTLLLAGGADAAALAALLNVRDPHRAIGADLSSRLAALPHEAVFAPIRKEAKRLARLALNVSPRWSIAQLAALAFPDRVALRRPGSAPRYLLSGGTGATLTEEDSLADTRLLVACETDGHGVEGRIRRAVPITEAELRDVHGDAIHWVDQCAWSRKTRRVETRQQETFGALVLTDRRWDAAPTDQVAAAMADGVRDVGLPWTSAARRLQARIALVPDLPDCSDAALLDDLEWLIPYLHGLRSASDLKSLDLVQPLLARIGWEGEQRLKTAAPRTFTTPLGRSVPIDYSNGGQPEISVRLQEMFGVTTHPQIGGAPVKVTLLSPAGRPVQTTLDIPGFWQSSYRDVRKEMRGRYPKHPWPEDPTAADPTLRAKPRKT